MCFLVIRYILIISVSLFFQIIASAQNNFEPFHIRYTVKDGLLDDEIYDLKFDSLGFLWVGTDEGLQRFDGHKFHAIKNFEILNEAATGITPIGNENFLYTDMRGGVFKANPDAYEKLDIPLPKPISIPKFYKSPKGDFWITSIHGSLKVGWAGEKIFDEKIKCTDLVEFNDKIYAFSNSIQVYDLEMNLLDSLKFINNEDKFRVTVIKSPYGLCVSEAHRKEIIILTKDHIQTLHQVKRPVLVLHFHKGSLFIGTRDGLDRYQWNGHTFEFIESFFEGSQISALCTSPDGQLWVGTLGEGLLRVFDTQLKNIHISDNRDYITKITAFNEDILLGTNKGRLFVLESGLKLKTISEEVKYLSILDIMSGNDSTFLVSSDSIYRYSKDYSYESLAQSGGCNLFIKNNSSTYYANNWSGIQRFDTDFGKTGIIFGPRFRNPVKTKDGMLVSQNGKVFAFNSNSENLDTLDKILGSVRKILTAGNLAFLKLTQGNEIIILDSSFSVIDSIYNYADIGELRAISKINDSYFLFGSQGIIKHNIGGKTIEVTLLPGMKISELHTCYYHNNQLYLSHSEGLVKIDVEYVSANGARIKGPHFKIRKIKLNDHELTAEKELQIPSGRSQIEIQFEIRDFESGKAPHIQYALNEENSNIDKNWIDISPDLRKVVLNDLPEGNTILNIRSDRNELASLNFTKAYPFWQQYWFFLVCIVFGLIISLPVFKIWALNKEKRNKEKVARIELEKSLQTSNLTSLKAQLNPHFLFNALNAIQSFMLKKDRLQASAYLNRFSKLMRTILQHSMEDLIVLEYELEAIKLYLELENLRFENAIIVDFETGEELKTQEIKIPAMIVQPFVENAIKHGLAQKNGEKTLNIRFLSARGYLKVEIEDNGIGREAAQKRKRQGEHISVSEGINRKRLEIINKLYNTNCELQIIDKIDEQQAPAGTKVILKIPMNL